MRRVLEAMRVEETKNWLDQYTEIQRTARRRKISICAHERPTASQLVIFCGWILFTTFCFGMLAITKPTSPIWGISMGVFVEILLVLALIWLGGLVPNAPSADQDRWLLSAITLTQNCGGVEPARTVLADALEDFDEMDGVTQLLLYTLLIGALVNASINNKFVDGAEPKMTWGGQ